MGCLNAEGSCKRAICECDKALAYDLADAEGSWNILHHARWGNFDAALNCERHQPGGRDGAMRQENLLSQLRLSAVESTPVDSRFTPMMGTETCTSVAYRLTGTGAALTPTASTAAKTAPLRLSALARNEQKRS